MPDKAGGTVLEKQTDAMNTINHLRWGTGSLLLVLLLWWESLTPFLPLFQPGWCDPVRHGLRNLAVALLNSGMTALVFAGFWTTAANYTEQHSLGIANWAGLAGWSHALATILLLDAWTYRWHRMNHTVAFPLAFPSHPSLRRSNGCHHRQSVSSWRNLVF